MTTKKIFIDILSDYLNKRESKIDMRSVDKECLINLAKKHNVAGVVYHQTNIQELKGLYYATLYMNANREDEEKQVFQAIAKFDYFPIKGQCIAFFYPVPQLRTMGDTDIVIREKDKLAVHTILCEKLGYVNKTQGVTVWNYNRCGTELEIHTKMINAKYDYDQKYEDYFLQCWDYVNNHELNWNFHFLYLIVHLRKHFMNSGVGIRQFMDIACVELNVNLDWQWLEKEARTIELFDFMKTVLSYINIWFGIASPYNDKIIEQDIFERSTELILNNGVFGFDNKENAINVDANQYLDGQNNDIKDIIIGRLFPSREQMVREKYMREGQTKMLLPIAWGKRIWSKRGHIEDSLNSIPSVDKINKRMQLYKHWGL